MALPEIGAEFAGYRIEELIGRGGMGVVYRAVQLRLERQVALKLILPELAGDANFRHRFERECRMAASLDHPNVIPIFEAGDVDDELFVSMRYVDGVDVGRLIAQRGHLEPQWAMGAVAQIADALDAAHSHGLVHRDVKPANVLIEGGGRQSHLYLTDFGLAKRVSSKTGLTRTRQFVGTVDYTAPEQITGGSVDYRADIYALGCLIFHVLTGHVPFERETDMAALWAQVNDPPPSVRSWVPALPAELDDVLARAMAKQPEDRYLSASDLATAAVGAVEGRRVALREQTVARGAAVSTPAPAGATQTALSSGAGIPVADWGALAATRDSSVALPAAGGVAAHRPLDSKVVPVAFVVAGAALAAAAAFVLGGVGFGSRSTSDAMRSASADGIKLEHPADWRPLARTPRIPGIHFIDPLSLAPAGAPEGEALVAGRVDAGGPPLLSRAFLRTLSAAPRRDDPVLLGTTPAYRYRDLRPRGFPRRLTLYVAPTTRGVVTIACMMPPQGVSTFMDKCERAASSLKLTSDVKAFSLRPGGRYAVTLKTTMAKLNATRKAGLTMLRASRSNVAQAASADRVAGAYGRAASTLATAVHSPAARDANTAIVRSMGRARASWTQLAAVARAGDPSGYARARAAALQADLGVRRALAQLEPLGYRVH